MKTADQKTLFATNYAEFRRAQLRSLQSRLKSPLGGFVTVAPTFTSGRRWQESNLATQLQNPREFAKFAAKVFPSTSEVSS